MCLSHGIVDKDNEMHTPSKSTGTTGGGATAGATGLVLLQLIVTEGPGNPK